MIVNLQDTVRLNNGIDMPGFGLGVYKAEDGETVIQAVKTAIASGYRSIDTASFYDNEEGVGEGIRQSGIAREEIFLTSKVWDDEQGYKSTLEAFDRSLNRLKVDYLDLYLIHWPVKGKYKDTWRALEELYDAGKVRAIGVSNFHIHHLEDLMKDANIKPAINQVEFHPHLTQERLRAYCRERHIQFESWSPLKRGRLLDDPDLKGIADRYGKSVAQVIIRWNIQHEVIVIPKSITEERIRKNADVFDFSLTSSEMATIDAMNIDDRSGRNPDEFDE